MLQGAEMRPSPLVGVISYLACPIHRVMVLVAQTATGVLVGALGALI